MIDDPVGYKRPPINTRFKPGTSGNPQGRPKGVRNFKTELREELGEIICIQDGERELKVSKQRAFITALVTSGLNGDLRAASLLASLCVQILRTESEDEQGGLAAPEDQEIVEGRGADLIIVDDPLDIKDASNLGQIELVNEFFDTILMSRLNNPKEGRIVIVAHRLHEGDLSGHVLEQGGWNHVVLPMVATGRKTYRTDYGKWRRKKDEVLRPDAFSPTVIDRLRKSAVNPDFDTLYQQDPSGGISWRIEPEHFLTVKLEDHDPSKLPFVLSIDPGQAGGARNSFSVIQVWCRLGEGHLLVNQWREQAAYSSLRGPRGSSLPCGKARRPCAREVSLNGSARHLLSSTPFESSFWECRLICPLLTIAP